MNNKNSNIINKFKMQGHMAKAVALVMCFVLFTTSVDITAFAFTGDVDSDKDIIGISALSDEIANQTVMPDSTLDDIEFPESLDVHVSYQVEREIASPTPTPSVEPTQSVDTETTEDTQGEDVDAPEEINEEDNQESDEPEQNVSADEPIEESNQPDDTQNEDIQNEDTESQPDGEQVAKISNGEYDSIETVYVPMAYFAAEPSEEEVVVETLGKDDSANEEDVSVSVEWSLDEEKSSKTKFKNLEAGEKYIFVSSITEDGYKLSEDVELPIITVTVEESLATFEQSVTVDDVVITVTADEGVFPEDATIEARKVTKAEENEVAEAIDEVRDEEKNVAVSYTFDITIYDKDGNEIEPDTEKGSVKVTFKMAEIANENLETDVYHVEETDEGLNAENLDVNTEDGEADEAAVETAGFSFYTVEFTYGELQYVLEGDEKVELSTVLDAVGIKENGEISKVESSNDKLFKPVFDEEEKTWYIESLKAFSSKEWLKVTMGEIEYEIVVTDDQTPGEWSKLKTALSETSPSSVENQFEVSSDDGIIIKLLADFTAGDGATELTVSGAKKLDLNGHVINANGKSMRVLTIPSGAELTLKDSDTTASHEGYIDADDIWHLGTGTGTSQAIAGGIITGGKAASDNSGGISDGGGVLVKGTLKMYGGSISGNTISYTNYSCGGGGIAVADSGVFEMHGGHITYNKAGNGGGVWNCIGTFNMYDDAVISNCKAAASGGGVFVENAPFNMYGGVIEKCEAESGQYGNGGGIFTHTNSTFTMTGGAIKNNTAAGNGAGVHNNLGTVTLGGKALITNNRCGTDYNDLYLPSNQTVQISTTTPPIKGMSVRVTLGNGTGKVTGTSGTDKYAQYFGSDKLSNGVVAKDGFVQIVSKTNVVACVKHNDQYIYYDSLQNAINAAGTEDEVQLLLNIQEDISVRTDKNITLDLNGMVLKGTGAKSTITVSSGASLTLCDSRGDVDHYYKYDSNGAWTWDDSPIGSAITVEEITDSTATGTPILLKGGAITGGCGTDISGKRCGGGIYNCGTLIMSGGNIVGNSVAWYGGGIFSIGSFELNGGDIVGNYTAIHGAGAYISGEGSNLIMIDGRIIYNASGDQAGGVYLNLGSFDLYGGSISHNHAQNLGGGVTCLNGTMKMYGGEISYNKAIGTDRFGYGGGLHNVANMYLYGGNISNNSAKYGAGIYNGYDERYEGIQYTIEGRLNITGGSVTQNNCSEAGGGVYYRNGYITLGKTAKITNNTKDTDKQNIYLPKDFTVAIADGDDAPASGMEVGVTMAANTGYFTTATATEECEKYFVADDSEKSVVFDSFKNQLQIVNGQTQKHDGITFLSWTSNNSLPTTSGNYYLAEDVTLSSQWNVPAGTTNLCLNGHVIKQTAANGRVIYISATATLNIYDCSDKEHYFTRNSAAEPWVLASDQTTPTELSVKGGVITGGVITVVDSGAGIFVDGKLSMYDGNVVGNMITNTTVDQVFGAGVFVRNSGVFDMYGGSIAGNACGANAGGVAVGANGNKTGAFNMYDGTISDNYAGLWGGGVNNWGTIVMKGGTIANNTAKTNGGGGVSNAATFTMTGGTIKNNNALTMGGGVVGDGTVTIGGTAVIIDNNANSLKDNLSVGGNMNFASEGPTTGMNVGVTTRKTGFPASISAVSNTDYSQYFTSDKDAYCIYYRSSDKMLYLASPATLTIDLNGGSYPAGSSALADWTYDSTSKKYSKKGSKVTLPAAPTAPAFMKFKGWKYNSNLYDAGTEIVFENTETRTYTAEYENIGSSIKTFATPGELIDPDCFALWYGHTGVAQKVHFGGMPWYIVGKDSADGSLVLMSAPGNFDNSTFGSSTIYSSSAVRTYLTTTALGKFTTAEQNMMQGLSSVGGDKLYLASGAYLQQGVAVGSDDKLYVSVLPNYATPGSPYTSGNWFWLRSSYIDKGISYVLIGYPGHSTGTQGIHFVAPNQVLGILPAMNLNLSSVLFASSAPVASASTTFNDGMNFRIVAGDKIGSSAMFTESKVSVTKGTDAGDLYLYVQGKDSGDWVWSTKVTENCSYDVSDIHSGADLSECVIWLETLSGDDRLAYAKEANTTSPYTVTLDDNGGNGGDGSVEVTLYSDMPAVTVPTKDDILFLGYFDEATGGTKYYNSDGTSAKAWDKSSDATLYAHWHTHSWTYFAGTGADNHHILYAVCSEPECKYYGTTEDVANAVSVSVSAPLRTLTYDGDDFEASVTDTDDKWATIIGIIPIIEYGYKEFGMEAASYSSVTDIKDAGYYKASITEGEKTAYVEYQIAKAAITPSVSIEGWTYGATASTPSVTGNTGNGTVTYKYKKASEADTAYTTTVPTACGDYTIKAEIAETKNYSAGSATSSFTISKAESTYTAPSAKQNLKYTGQDQELVTAGATDDGTMKYCLTENGEYSTDIPVGKDAKEYTVYYKVVGDENHNDTTPSSVTVTIGKGEWSVTAPVAKTGLAYTGSAQALITLGSAEGGTMQYRVGTEGSFGASEEYYSGTNAGIYNVYYKVAEDSNHKEYASETPISISIAKADWIVTAPTAIAPSYTGSAKELVNAGVVKNADGSVVANKILYSLTGNADDYSSTIPTATTVGSYKVYYKVAGDDNHNSYAAKFITATVEKADRPSKPTVTMSGYTYGQTDSLPSPALSETPSDGPSTTYYYASENDFTKASEWKNITATTLNAGTYYMFAKLSETTSYRSCNTEGAEFTIAKATCTVTAPTGKTLKYNGQAQELINAGSAVGGTMMYSLDDATYSANLPKAMDRGDYTVHYYALGDANHENSAKQTVTATIGMGEHAVTAPRALNPVYSGSEQVLISAGSCTSGTILYSLDGETYYESINEIKGKDIASYTVYYKVEGNANYGAYGPKQITTKIIDKPAPTPKPSPDPEPTPDPTPYNPVVIPTAPPQGNYAETGLTTKRYVTNGGTTVGIGSTSGTNENQVALPYVTSDAGKAGWTSIDQALKSYKQTKESKTEPFSVTMNGYATVDNQLLSDVNTQKIDLALNLDNDVEVVVPKENKIINNAIEDWSEDNALKSAAQQTKLEDSVYFRVSAITTNDAKSNRMTNAGLDIKDIIAIGGDVNTPVVKVVTSNTLIGLGILKSQMIQISFDTTNMTCKYKPGDTVYLYNGSAKAGVGCYRIGKVDKDGKVRFWVPMVSSYWTIGNKNLGFKIKKH